MNSYLITYDLRNNKDYTSLHEAIKTHHKWGKVTESTWIVVSAKSAMQIRDDLFKVMDSDDRLFVLKSGVEAAWMNSICDNDWLQENLS